MPRKSLPAFPPPPPDFEAEAMLVGYCIDPVSPQAVVVAAESLDDGAVQGELSPVWRCIRSITLAGRSPTIPEIAASAGPPWTVGKVAGLMRDDLPTDAMFRAVDALVELGRRRRLYGILSSAAAAASTDGADTALSILDTAGQVLQKPQGVRRLIDVAADTLLAARQAVEDREAGEPTGATGLPTGLAPLDRLTGGLEPGDLWVLAGRTSQGKTSLALQIALTQQTPVLFVSAEVTAERLGRKALASRAAVPVPKMRMGALDDHDLERMEAALNALGRSQVVVDDHSRTVTAIRATARTVARKYGHVGLLVVDYLQLLDPEVSGRDGRNRQEVVASISRSLKAMALEQRIPVLALAQLSRAAEEDREPELRHLRESGAIEQDADVVVLIHRPPGHGDEPWQNDPRAHRPLHLNVAKQRDGETAFVPCIWDPTMQTVTAEATAAARHGRVRGPRADIEGEGGRVVPMGRDRS